jgi:hypothetical protein
MMNIIEWCMFSVGCPSKKEHATMQSYIKIVGKESGNATYWTQFNGWKLILLHFHFLLKKIQP